MTCRECLEQFSEMSADNVSASTALSIREHLKACPQCVDEARAFEHTLFILSASSQPLPTPQISDAMWQYCSEHVFQKVEAKRSNSRATRPGLAGWFARQPLWGWASLAGAFAILTATWFLAPHEDALNALNEEVNVYRNTPTMRAGLITFERPPASASALVNHHSAMAADPFTDNVGSTLVSYSATSSATSQATAPQTAAPQTITPHPAVTTPSR
jgi:hypothetical protein